MRSPNEARACKPAFLRISLFIFSEGSQSRLALALAILDDYLERGSAGAAHGIIGTFVKRRERASVKTSL